MKTVATLFITILSQIAYADNACTINGDKFSNSYKQNERIKFSNTALNCERLGLIELEQMLAGGAPIELSVDLNSDGKCEYFIHDKDGSGSGGALYFIYMFNNGEFTTIGEYQSWGITPTHKNGNWYQLISSDLSGREFLISTHTFTNGKYTSSMDTFKCNESTALWEQQK